MSGTERPPSPLKPDLDQWLPDPSLRVHHSRHSTASPAALWEAASSVALADTGLLGRLVRWRIPGLARDTTFDTLFREPPFVVLADGEYALVSGLVGRIWTLRRDYPELDSPEEFLEWSQRGTARVVLANWVLEGSDGRSSLVSEGRVEALGSQGRVGLAAVRPIVRAFQNLVGSEGISAAVRRAESNGG
ncbi:MAG: hypothetical protein WAL22_13700 [Solirubrobacteraceae bacterium]